MRSILRGIGSVVVLGLLSIALRAMPATAAPFAYVANSDSNTVSVIDTASNTVVATVPVGRQPFGVAITPDGVHAYVANRIDSTVSVIDTASNTVVTTVPVGLDPDGVAIAPAGAHAYVANGLDSTVSVIAIQRATLWWPRSRWG
jgi:YVTN family beta-propeller protein